MRALGYFHGVDPAACLVEDGDVVAYVEEERLIRFKHANDIFPIRSIDFCLKQAGITLADVDVITLGWDIDRYTNGEIREFFDATNEQHPPDAGTVAWQNNVIRHYSRDAVEARTRRALVSHFGVDEIPPIVGYPHHESHALTAHAFSPYDRSLVLTVDGSGDHQTMTIWKGEGQALELLHEMTIPNSLGWFYAAITEVLGFKAYDGEYKVMGLAAYGRPNDRFRSALEQVVRAGPDGFDYRVDPRYIHHGAHSYSDRYTDELIELLRVRPRLGDIPLNEEYEDLAFEAQRMLEVTVERYVKHWVEQTGIRKLAISGGVGLNIKMNSRLHRSDWLDDLFIFPIPSDSGTSIGSAIGVLHRENGSWPEPLEHVFWGPSYTDEEILKQVESCGLAFEVHEAIEREAAKLIADGNVVAWFQGALEGGPRALGGRSILADPRREESRDRVNAAIKFREYWRPFCPSLKAEAGSEFLQDYDEAPYMILSFGATDRSRDSVPAVVHTDDTMRAQTVTESQNRRYWRLLDEFEKVAGVPVLLNTSFNIKGEAIVCSPRDALRTFWSTGIDALVMGKCLIRKPNEPLALPPEEVIR
jgi:carbamoyltransferase